MTCGAAARTDITPTSARGNSGRVVDRAQRITLLRARGIGRRAHEIPTLAARLSREPRIGGETRCELAAGHEQYAVRRRVEPRGRIEGLLRSFEPATMSEVDGGAIEIEQELLLVRHECELFVRGYLREHRAHEVAARSLAIHDRRDPIREPQ